MQAHIPVARLGMLRFSLEDNAWYASLSVLAILPPNVYTMSHWTVDTFLSP